MSASSSPLPSPHRIGIVMSPLGRFLVCRDCPISFQYPAGAQFAVVAKQFQSHLCGPPIHNPDWQIGDIAEDTARIERRLVKVRYEGRAPAMASCAKCERRFFTPTTLALDAVGAEEYLRRKFNVHDCAARIEERGGRKLF